MSAMLAAQHDIWTIFESVCKTVAYKQKKTVAMLLYTWN